MAHKAQEGKEKRGNGRRRLEMEKILAGTVLYCTEERRCA